MQFYVLRCFYKYQGLIMVYGVSSFSGINWPQAHTPTPEEPEPLAVQVTDDIPQAAHVVGGEGPIPVEIEFIEDTPQFAQIEGVEGEQVVEEVYPEPQLPQEFLFLKVRYRG